MTELKTAGQGSPAVLLFALSCDMIGTKKLTLKENDYGS